MKDINMNDFNVNITWNERETLAHLTWIERDQYPFAHAKALTRIAQESAEVVRKRTKQKFELKTDFIPKGIKIKPAKKADITRGGRASSSVFTAERISGFMPKQETGGERKPGSGTMGGGSSSKGKSLAIPGKGVAGSQFATTKLARKRLETASGKISKSKTPHALLNRLSQSGQKKTQQVKRGGSKKSPFVIRGKTSGIPMIVRRVGKKRYPLEILYIFRPSASYKKTWGMIDTVVEYVHKNYERVFTEELKAAVKGAK
jgi:hypothetical protein